MTANRRIVLNIIATYGRSLLNVLCGLFSVRWVLEALGHTDYGLYGVVGGLVVFIEFLNSQFSGAISRFYAISIGQRQSAKDEVTALEDCREWFSTSLSIHFVLPLVLMTIGYPLGISAIQEGWINIPENRVDACIWVWRFVCINALTAMMVAPIWAMYIAKQNIAELTIFGVGQTIVRTGFIFYMTTKPGDWMVCYGIAMCLIGVVPRFLYSILAVLKFEECRIRIKAFKDWGRIRQLYSYVSWRTLDSFGSIVKGQGMSVFANNFFSGKVNAAMSVGTQLAGETASLTGALINAFRPAIITAYGANDIVQMHVMVFRVCKFGTLLTLVFAVPLMIELDEVLMLWLKTPPPYVNKICMSMIICFLIEKLSQGYLIAIEATGQIALHCVLRLVAYILALIVLLVSFTLDFGVQSIAISLILCSLFIVSIDVYVARLKIHLGVSEWMKNVVIPILVIAFCTIIIALLPSLFMTQSFVRICITTFVSTISFFVLTVVWGLDVAERNYLGFRGIEIMKIIYKVIKVGKRG